MISISFRPLIIHILLFSTFATEIKILQLSETMENLSNGKSCSSKQYIDLMNFVKKNKPNIILWFSEFRESHNCFNHFNRTVQPSITVLPVLKFRKRSQKCIQILKDYSCYYAHTVSYHNISFIVLNTALWLNELHDNSSKKQIKWLKDELIRFQKQQKKVIVVGYDTPGSLEIYNATTQYETYFNNALVELFQMFSTTITQCIFGGERIDSYRIIFNNGKPVFPLFLFPTNDSTTSSIIPNIRIYNLNNATFLTNNYKQFHRNSTAKYGYNETYDMENVHIQQLFKFTESFFNVTFNFQRYYTLQLKKVSFAYFCGNGHLSCVKCCSRCFILHLILSNLTHCLSQCNTIKMVIGISNDAKASAKNNNAFYVLGVIVGFVVILLGIVLAVNKTYCIRRNRQRNVFLTPLTLDIHTDLNDDVLIDAKFSTSNPITNHAKTLNGHRRSNYEIEQTYDYIRM